MPGGAPLRLELPPAPPPPPSPPPPSGRLPARGSMSRVRLSSGGSPALERPDASPKPSACRSLFGPVDRDELARELRRHRRQLAQAGRAAWNFDFQRHRPLGGRYEWQALDPHALPDFYSRPPRLRAARPGHGDGGDGGPPRPAAEPPQAAPPAQPRKRPAEPDDSSHQNKRANATEVIPEDSPSASSVEQTPKKSSPRRHQT